MPIKSPGLSAYHKHKARARDAGVEFSFTFDQWKAWWESQLGPDWLKLRCGMRRDSFCMARIGDVGPYSPSNVRCLTRSENSKEQRHPTCENAAFVKLTREQVLEIRASYKPYSRESNGYVLSLRYGVTRSAIAKCVRGETWQDPALLWTGEVNHSNRVA